MMSRTLGAPLGGTTRGGHHDLESLTLSLIAPPNSGGGGGSCLPSIVTVALGVPGVPVVCWAIAPGKWLVPRRKPNESAVVIFIAFSLLTVLGYRSKSRPPATMHRPATVVRHAICRRRWLRARSSRPPCRRSANRTPGLADPP